MRLLAVAASVAAVHAGYAPGWDVIASKIGGSPLGVACFEDGATCITAVSQILPAGYEALRSLDGGATWATVPDQDLFVFGLYNSAVAGTQAVISGMEFIQVSVDKAANFSAAPNSLSEAGGQIVRHLLDEQGLPNGFAIMGMTDDGNTNGFIQSYAPTQAWTEVNVAALGTNIAVDGCFLNASWLVAGNTYETSAAQKHPLRTRKLRRAASGRGLEATPAHELAAADYATQLVASTDAAASWQTVYSNSKIAVLSVACIDAQHCCFVGEDANYAYAVCTSDGWGSTTIFTDSTQGAALVEVAVAPGTCPQGSATQDAYVIVGGVVDANGQAPSWYRSCDFGKTFTADPSSVPVANLLVTDVDCQPHTPNGTQCWTTLWDNSGVDPNGYVAKFFA